MTTKSALLTFMARVALNAENAKTPLDLTGYDRLAWKLSAGALTPSVLLPPVDGKPDPAVPLLGTLHASKHIQDIQRFKLVTLAIRSRCPMKLSVKQGVTKQTRDQLEPICVELNLSTGTLASAIVGARFRGPEASRAVMKLKTSDAFSLEREPTNKFDSAAVLVTQGKLQLGYIPRTESGFVSFLMDELGIVPTVELVLAGASPNIRLHWGKV